MPSRKHDDIAKVIARKYDVPYNKSKGPDIKTTTKVIEVEVDKNKFGEGIQQLQGSQKLRYLAVPKELIKAAVERTEGLKTGVMGPSGKVEKPAQRPKKS